MYLTKLDPLISFSRENCQPTHFRPPTHLYCFQYIFHILCPKIILNPPNYREVLYALFQNVKKIIHLRIKPPPTHLYPFRVYFPYTMPKNDFKPPKLQEIFLCIFLESQNNNTPTQFTTSHAFIHISYSFHILYAKPILNCPNIGNFYLLIFIRPRK